MMNKSVTHAFGCINHVWYESQRKFDMFRPGNNIKEYSPLRSCSSLGGGEKDATTGLLFQDNFKEETVGGCWHCHVELPLPKIWRKYSFRACCEFPAKPALNIKHVFWTTIKEMHCRGIILDAKYTN